jgi:histidine decarboxylase
MSKPTLTHNPEERPMTLDADHVSPPPPAPPGYPVVDGINSDLFQLPSEGLTDSRRRAALAELAAYQRRHKDAFLGYQANQALNFAAELAPYLDYHINNIGDPFASGNFMLNSKWMERAVLDSFARLWHAKWPHDLEDPDAYWGTVLTMGSTEGNLYALWNGRDYLAGKALLFDKDAVEEAKMASLASDAPQSVPLRLMYQQAATLEDSPNAWKPVCFYSQESHYSIPKAMRVLEITTFYELGNTLYPGDCPEEVRTPAGGWPKEVPSEKNGEGSGAIDVEKLAILVDFFAALGHPILVSLNYGTTFKGAHDDVAAVGEALMPIVREYGLEERDVLGERRNGFWIHVDGALGAAYMPFVEMAHAAGELKDRGPNFDFRLEFVHSIVTSGHKWIGAPWPCGVFMTKNKYLLRAPNVGVIGTPDTTFAGSRNGFSAMILWHYLATHSHQQQTQKAVRANELAHYMTTQLEQVGREIDLDLWVERAPLSLTIHFRRPNPDIIAKHSLSNEDLLVGGITREYSHMFVMDHVDKQRLDALIADLRSPGAFLGYTGAAPLTAAVLEEVESYVVDDARHIVHVPDAGRGFK